MFINANINNTSYFVMMMVWCFISLSTLLKSEINQDKREGALCNKTMLKIHLSVQDYYDIEWKRDFDRGSYI